MWQTVKGFTGCLSKAFRDAYKGLRKALIGSEGGDEPQWRSCIQDTNNALGFAIGAIFVREVFHGDSKTQAEEMINNVKNAFKRNFKNLKWMDSETRKAAEMKADAISDMIGYPEFILDMNQLDERYKSLDVRNDTYFQNNINFNLYTLRKNLEKINEPVNKTSWSEFDWKLFLFSTLPTLPHYSSSSSSSSLVSSPSSSSSSSSMSYLRRLVLLPPGCLLHLRRLLPPRFLSIFVVFFFRFVILVSQPTGVCSASIRSR